MNRDFIRAHALEFGYAAAGVVLFPAFLLATFPYADALSAALAPAGLEVVARGQEFRFPFGLNLRGVRLAAAGHPGGRPLFESERMQLAPALLSLALGAPAINLKAEAYGGELALMARPAGGAAALAFTVAGVRLERCPGLRALGAQLAGEVSAAGAVRISANDLGSDRGDLRLSARNASVRIVAGMPPVRLGVVTAMLKLDHGKLAVASLSTSGGELILSARGVIELQPNLPDSAIALKFELHPSPAARSRLGFLLNLLPHPPGATPYLLHGTFAAPLLS